MDNVSKFIAIAAFLFPFVLLSSLEDGALEQTVKDDLVMNDIGSITPQAIHQSKNIDSLEFTKEKEIENLASSIGYKLSLQRLSDLSTAEHPIVKAIKKKETLAHLYVNDNSKLLE